MNTETFQWEYQTYDVSTILRDTASGALQPSTIDWPAAAVKAYFDLYLDPMSPNPRPPLRVDLQYALSLPLSRLDVPIVLVYVEDRGLVAYEGPDDEPHHVIADGNHRVALAAAKGVGLHAFVLSREQSKPYEFIIEPDEA